MGVLLDEKMNFKNHINSIVNKAKSTLAWIKRFSYEFNDPFVIKRLFETFVLPTLEYASQIWSPKFKNAIVKIESIQKQFLLFALRKLKNLRGSHEQNEYHLPPYRTRLHYFNMNTLEDRRTIYQLLFVIYLINGKISSPYLLNELRFRVPQRNTRNYLLLDENINMNNSQFYNIKRTFNDIFSRRNEEGKFIIDFNQSTDTVKTKLKQYFSKNSE